MDTKWRGWVAENLQRGCDPGEIKAILLQNHFTLPTIKKAMGAQFPAFKEDAPAIDYEALCLVRITQPESGAVAWKDDRLQLYTLENFISEAECDAIVEIMNPSLRPSTITVASTDKYFRNSSTSDLSLLNHPTVLALDEKIARTLGIRLPYSEGIQAQHYEVGQQFKAHTDYFEPATPEYERFATTTGNRTWTFMVYLNNTLKGGGTEFTRIGKTFYPKKGMAVIWNNLLTDGTPNLNTEHCGMPVEAGHKDIITKWFRERGKGEMFY